MSIGQKFLTRVLSEAKKDDAQIEHEMDFDMGHLTPQTKSLAASLRLTQPAEKKIAAFMLMCGVRAKDLKADESVGDKIREAAQKFKRSAPLRMAFDDMFTSMAEIKGISQSTPATVNEAIVLKGDTWQKMLERVLIAMGMSEELASSTNVQAGASLKSLLKTTQEIEQNEDLQPKLKLLARRLGVAATLPQATPVEEALQNADRPDLFSGVTRNEFTNDVLKMLSLLGVGMEEMENAGFRKIIANAIRKDNKTLSVAQMVPTLRTCIRNLEAARGRATKNSSAQQTEM